MPVARAAAVPFRMSTRQRVVQVPAVSMATVGGSDIPINLPNSGYMGNIYVQVKGTVSTIAGTAAGHFDAYPYLPYSLVKRFVMKNNLGGALIDVSGWGLTLLNLTRARVKQLESPSIGPWNTTNTGAVWAAPGRTAAVAASTAYNVCADYTIPVPTDDALELGLLLVQNNSLINQLIITPPASADITGSITGVTPLTMNTAISPAQEFFDAPAASGSQPDTTWLHLITETLQTGVVANSDVIYRPAPGPVYLRMIGMVEAGSPLLPVSYGGITKLQFRFGQSNYVYQETYDEHLARMWDKYGIVLPDGMFVFDYTLGYGIAGIVEPRDFMDTSQFTDVQVVVSLSNSVGTTPQIRWINEYLAPNAAPRS